MLIVERVDNTIHTPIPHRGTLYSAGLDLYLATVGSCRNGVYTLGTNFKMKIPEGQYGEVTVRSSWGIKGLQLANQVGIIDSDYRGEILLKATFEHRGTDFPEVGTRIAQIVIQEYKFHNVILGVVGDTDRGTGGFGSTG